MGVALLIFLVFFPIAMGVAAFPLGRRDKDLRDWFVIAVTGVELAAAGALLLFQGTEGWEKSRTPSTTCPLSSMARATAAMSWGRCCPSASAVTTPACSGRC